MARKLAPSIDPVVVDVAAVEEENVKERERRGGRGLSGGGGGCQRTSTW